eukprot:UN34434
MDFMEFLDVPELLRLERTSHTFYTYTNFKDVWRKKTLEEYPGDFIYKDSWKRTYLTRRFRANTSQNKWIPREIKLSTMIYSDHLFQSLYYSYCDIKEHWLEGDNIDIRNDLSCEDFRKDYEFANQPVVIRNIVNKWTAYKTWTWKYLEDKFGQKKFLCGGFKFAMKDYFSYLKNIQDDQILYLFDHLFANDTDLGDHYEVPKHLQEDLFK